MNAGKIDVCIAPVKKIMIQNGINVKEFPFFFIVILQIMKHKSKHVQRKSSLCDEKSQYEYISNARKDTEKFPEQSFFF